MATKICKGPCGLEKDINEFWITRGRFRKTQCKDCLREINKIRSKKYCDNHKDKRLAWRASLLGRYSIYKCAAKGRGIVFDLTLDQFKALTEGLCIYCGEHSAEKDFCGIDRVDSDNGYVIDNCVSCCRKCNLMKHLMSHEDFIAHMIKILKYIHRI